ncbi:MerR family transcriptional regulator [Micromonospora auratinigra]|uniref:Serine/threonine protein phosphatase PrpC n=1 Tax=Micromonospora auratinigra TaxID=261654 RepID=A0A1A9A1G4_9ACTN|nr:MerR family transcriptional regulator [Micromonospora auratinigra]SBT50038.1 Serine/threonine protein phosphatase PrpC [Micromonospora auratinigra]
MQLLTIGAFARAARLTPKALRLYDGLGLLPPAAVDPHSGYRYYEAAQLDRARLIAALRRAGMPLAEIQGVCRLPAGEAAGAVDAWWRRVSADTTARGHVVALLVDQLSERSTVMSGTTFRHAVRCETGAVRESNEDTAYAGDTLLAVADGLRGPGGAAASAAAVDALRPLELADAPAAELLATLAEAITTADRTVRGQATAEHQPATTLTAVLRRGTQLALVHVGDTRAYLLRGGELCRLTQDHTYVQSQVDQGRLTPAEAAAHPQRALLSRALGAGTPVEADLALRTALPGDRYLLCSDGLSAVVGPAALRDTLAAADDPETAVGRLVELAYAAGAPDNVACVVADLVTG